MSKLNVVKEVVKYLPNISKTYVQTTLAEGWSSLGQLTGAFGHHVLSVCPGASRSATLITSNCLDVGKRAPRRPARTHIRYTTLRPALRRNVHVYDEITRMFAASHKIFGMARKILRAYIFTDFSWIPQRVRTSLPFYGALTFL